MRRFLTAVLAPASLALAAIGVAHAADLPVSPYYQGSALAAAYNWAGPYLGGTLGYEWGQVSNDPSHPTHPAGIAGGVEGGYNWQNGAFVFGGEADINLSGADDTSAPHEFSSPWFGTVRGRAGAAISNLLLYGTAGLAYGDLRADVSGLTESHAGIGWTAGAGIEVGFTPRWSAKAEWLYLDLPNRTYSVTGEHNGFAANVLRMGINYHF